MSNAERIADLVGRAGISTKHVWFGGSHGIVTCRSHDTADRVVTAMKRASFKTRGPVESIDYAEQNKGTTLNPSVCKVWRVGVRV